MTVFSKVVTGVKRRTTASATHPSTTTHSGMDTALSAASSSSTLASATAQLESAGITPRTRTKENTRVVAPDLRRFSDFMNPFPTISPGGYTKYYQARAAAAASSSSSSAGSTSTDPSSSSSSGTGGPARPSQYALPSLCELNQRPQPPRTRPPPIQTTGLQQPGVPRGSVGRKAKKKAVVLAGVQPVHGHPLASIPESASESAQSASGGSHKPRSRHTRGGSAASSELGRTNEDNGEQNLGRGEEGGSGPASASASSPMGSLRRKKRQVMLRTPSVERDFAAISALKGAKHKPSQEGGKRDKTKLGRAASVSSAQSSKSAKSSKSTTSSHRSSPSSSSSCGDSSMDSSNLSSSDGLITPDSSLELEAYPPPPSAFIGYYGDKYDTHRRVIGGQGAADKGLGHLSSGKGSGHMVGLGMGLGTQGEWEPFERPDSRSTYRTARTHFDDI